MDEYDKPILAVIEQPDQALAPVMTQRVLYGYQEQGGAGPLGLRHRSEPVVEGHPVLRAEQPGGHQPESQLGHGLWLD